MSVIFEVIDVWNLVDFILWVIFPTLMVLYAYLFKKFFCTAHVTYLVISTFAIGIWQGIGFFFAYAAILVGFCIWWSKSFHEFRMNNPEQYEEYLRFYSEYFSDDLNNDGIKDAFEHWEIAHDPRFFWLFASKKAKLERKARMNGKAVDDYFKRDNNWRERNDRGYGNQDSSNTKSADWNSYGSNRGKKKYEGSYQYNQGTQYRAGNNDYQRDTSNMSDAEKQVAKQHAFAKKYDLRYFAMCSSKDEAKKLYRKYATKFHPDNSITGDKDKFIKIDEEYNRFCKIPEIS